MRQPLCDIDTEAVFATEKEGAAIKGFRGQDNPSQKLPSSSQAPSTALETQMGREQMWYLPLRLLLSDVRLSSDNDRGGGTITAQ